MDPVSIASVLVTIITVTAAYATSRASAKASRVNTETTSRVDMEKEAYLRAQAFDVGTIKRQDEELDELRAANRALMEEIKVLRQRIARLERDNPNIPEELPNV